MCYSKTATFDAPMGANLTSQLSCIATHFIARNPMPIDLSEKLLDLTAAAQILPGRPNVSTLWRWSARGVRGVKLETCVVGGKRFTSHEALARFAARCSAAADGTPVPVRTSRQRAAAQRAAERELDEAGL
jgi:hypothetical protein